MQCHAIVGAAVNALPSRATPEDANANPVFLGAAAPLESTTCFKELPLSMWVCKMAASFHSDAGTLTPSAVPSAVLMPTFVEAVRSKYEYKKSEDNAAEAGSYGVVGGEKTGKKQALDVLTNVYVPSAGIDSPGADGEIGSTCGAITELDIGGNGFVSWPPILAIAVQLPKLHWLGLDKMPLAPLASLPDNFGTAVGGLRTLWLDGTGMAWEQLLFLASAMPLLEEVHFSSNQVSTLQPSSAEVPVAASALPKLHSLYLEGNAISRWEDLEPLGALPALTQLNLNFNQLVSVPPPPPAHAGAGGVGAVSGTPFSTLRHLMLRRNKLDS